MESEYGATTDLEAVAMRVVPGALASVVAGDAASETVPVHPWLVTVICVDVARTGVGDVVVVPQVAAT
jgi:hypothetical protein